MSARIFLGIDNGKYGDANKELFVGMVDGHLALAASTNADPIELDISGDNGRERLSADAAAAEFRATPAAIRAAAIAACADCAGWDWSSAWGVEVQS